MKHLFRWDVIRPLSSFARIICLPVVVLAFGACQSSQPDNPAIQSGLSQANGQVILHSKVNGTMCGSLYTSYNISGPNGSQYTIRNEVYLFENNKPKLEVKSLPAGKYQLITITCPEVYEISGTGPIATFIVTAAQTTNLGVIELQTADRSYTGMQKSVRPFTQRELEGLNADRPKIAASLIYQPMATGASL